MKSHEDSKEFEIEIRKLEGKYKLWQIWQDFIYMFASAISNSVDEVHFETRENDYLNIIGKYDKDEQPVFPRLCYLVTNALDQNKDRDFLGELYMRLGMGNHWTGQFFTPYSISKMNAKLILKNLQSEIKEKGYTLINDPTCGAGALLIAAANTAEWELKETEYNWQNHVLFTAQDIDMVAGLMCYIQLSLIGCAGYVKIGNTLLNPMAKGEAETYLNKGDSSYWYTPTYFSDIWQWRRLFRRISR